MARRRPPAEVGPALPAEFVISPPLDGRAEVMVWLAVRRDWQADHDVDKDTVMEQWAEGVGIARRGLPGWLHWTAGGWEVGSDAGGATGPVRRPGRLPHRHNGVASPM